MATQQALQKSLLVLALAAACCGVQAQTPTPTPSSPAKKELVARIVKAQQPGIEMMARELMREPATELVGRAMDYMQAQVPPEKREAIAKGIQADGDKFMNEAVPLVRDRAVKLAPTALGPLLEEKFTEDELKQVATMLESPIYAKYQTLGGEMQQALVTKLLPDVRPVVQPKLKALDDSIAKRLGITAPPAGAAAPAPGAGAGAAAPKAPAKK
jgi:signal transduction histidine kinase